MSPVALGLSVYQYHLQNVNHREAELYQGFQPAKIVGFIDLMPSRSPDSLASRLLGAPKGPGSQALGLSRIPGWQGACSMGQVSSLTLGADVLHGLLLM